LRLKVKRLREMPPPRPPKLFRVVWNLDIGYYEEID